MKRMPLQREHGTARRRAGGIAITPSFVRHDEQMPLATVAGSGFATVSRLQTRQFMERSVWCAACCDRIHVTLLEARSSWS
jgi:hypothetical protein